MNPKRWTALIIAVVLFIGSIGINAVFSFFKTDFFANIEDFVNEQSELTNTQVLEQGKTNDKIAYIKLDGTIQDVEMSAFSTGYNHKNFLSQLKQIKEDDSIKGVVFAVNTPGGGVIESAEIRKKIMEIQATRDIPVYVSMGAMAASGGYYVSAPADKIFAMQETITGSIGVIMQTINYQELAEKLGVRYEKFQSGIHKDMLSPTREVTEEERKMMQEMIDESYGTFVNIIAEGRNMSEADVKKVADGRIMSGTQAMKAGLVDEIADEETVIQQMREDYDLTDAQLITFADPTKNWRTILGVKASTLFGPSLEERFVAEMLTKYNAPQMMYLYGAN